MNPLRFLKTLRRAGRGKLPASELLDALRAADVDVSEDSDGWSIGGTTIHPMKDGWLVGDLDGHVVRGTLAEAFAEALLILVGYAARRICRPWADVVGGMLAELLGGVR